MSPASLSRIWKQDGWIRRLSGLMCEPSMAQAWRGKIDCVTAGYPCQPFSIAGRKRADQDPRHLWPHVGRIVGECQPTWCFFENVANHLSLGFEQVCHDLGNMGYAVAAGLFSAEEVGAPHRRERLFILAQLGNTKHDLPQRSAEAMERLMGDGGQREGRSRPSNLREQILWPTPRAQKVSSENPEAWSARQQAGKVATPPLPLAAAMWPTITAQDAKNNAGASQFQRNTKPLNVEAALHCSRPTPTATGAASQPILNPVFTEWLMGWPIGWTESAPAVTGWCRWQQHMRGALSALVSIRTEHERFANSALPA